MSNKQQKHRARTAQKQKVRIDGDNQTRDERSLGAVSRHSGVRPGYFEPMDVGTIKQRILVKPRTTGQEQYWDNLTSGTPICVSIGPAGTGKTFLACAAAVAALKAGEVERVIITRPAVESDEELGFLPGGVDSKMMPYVLPIIDCFVELVGGRTTALMMEKGVLSIRPFAFMRGSTFRDTFIIADEMSNSSPHQFKCLLTRMGEGSKLVVLGDPTQSDRKGPNGMTDFAERLSRRQSRFITVDQMDVRDVVRHEAIRDILELYEEAA